MTGGFDEPRSKDKEGFKIPRTSVQLRQEFIERVDQEGEVTTTDRE